ncbi:hypothetical protein HK101_007715 [Irineochytrium annulatum]|nr:hypothetical protein HK101_007715 [Irineochytrium annulatum]
MGLLTALSVNEQKATVVVWAAKWIIRSIKRSHQARRGLVSGEPCSPDSDGKVCFKWSERDVATAVRKVAIKAKEWADQVERSSPNTTSATDGATPVNAEDEPATVLTSYDLVQKDGKVVVSVDVPGFRREELSVTVLDNERVVLVKGASVQQRKKEVDVRVVLPKRCSTTDVNVTLTLGVLSIEAVMMEHEGRRVAISGGSPKMATGEFDDGWEKKL